MPKNFNRSCLFLSFTSLLNVNALADNIPNNELATPSISIDELVVKAARKRQALGDVPIAVSAFTADDIIEKGIDNLGDLQGHIPNANLHLGDAGNATIYLRGVGQIDSLSFMNPGVGVYVDDVYLGRSQGSFLDTLDIAQIEVLRGPQGTFYGRNTIGGAVKYITNQPNNVWQGYIDVGVGNYDQQEFHASIGGPIMDSVLLGRIAVSESNRDGYADNVFDGDDDFDKKSQAFRSTLNFLPTDKLSFILSFDGSKNDPSHSRTPHRETPIYSVTAGDFIAPGDDPFTVNVNYNDRESLETAGVALTTEYDANNKMLFTSITAYREMEYFTHLDLDGTTDSSFDIFSFEDQKQVSQEFQFIYLGESVSLVSGLYYFNEENAAFSGALAPDFFVDIAGVGIVPFPFLTAGGRDQENTSTAVYFNVDFDINKSLTLALGMRYTEEELTVTNLSEDYAGTEIDSAEGMQAVFNTGVGLNPVGYTATDEWSSFSPRVALTYHYSEKTLAYGSISRGFKSGGFNGRVSSEPLPFEPETLTSYEVGYKTVSNDRSTRLNAAVFFYDYNDYQLSRFSVDPDSGAFLSLFENAGEAKIYGAEIELNWLYTQNLSLNMNMGYLEGSYEELIGDFEVDVSDDRELVNAPQWNGRIGINYDLFLQDAGSLKFGFGVTAQSKSYLTVSSNEALAQAGYGLLDASAVYRPPNGQWTVTFTGENLSDREVREHAFDLSSSPGVLLGYYKAPRTYRVKFRLNF